jgi:polyhydroxybutyrate depolymerase
MSWSVVQKVVVSLVLTPLTMGCAGDAPVSQLSDASTRTSTGCGTTPPISPGESGAFSMGVGELDREYRLHLAPTYDPGRATPLVLDFHGYTGTAASEETYTGLSRHADEHGYAVVYPQGTGFILEQSNELREDLGFAEPESDDGRLITSWNDLAGSVPVGSAGPICSEAGRYPHPPECGEPQPCVWATCHDDLGFIARLLDRLEEELCVDLDRVYATGMSNGGMFVHRLGCDMPERFAAIAPVGGTLARGFNCAPEVPLAIMNIYGRRDGYVSQRGDTSSDGYYYESAEAVIEKWAGPGSQRCDAVPSDYPTSRDGVLGLACIQHDNCATGAEVVHCTWDGAHDWPQADNQPVGNEIIWAFFSRHTRESYRVTR